MAARQINAKIVFLGESAVGKTSVVTRKSRNEFFEFNEPTIGAAFQTVAGTVEGKKVQLEIWDTAGQCRYRSLAPMYYRGATAAVVVYDVTNPESLIEAKVWMEELTTRVGDKCSIFLVGNKSDLEHRVKESAVVDIIEEYTASEINHIEVSAKTGAGIENLFNDIMTIVYEKLKHTGGVNEENNSSPFHIRVHTNEPMFKLPKCC